MDKPFCEKCGKGMYRIGVDIDPSCGLQSTEYQCFSLNNHHRIGIVEPIPNWGSFRQEKEEKIIPQVKRMTPRQKRRILKMLVKEMPLVKISQKTGFSSPAICRLKAITLLAAMGMAIKNQSSERRQL